MWLRAQLTLLEQRLDAICGLTFDELHARYVRMKDVCSQSEVFRDAFGECWGVGKVCVDGILGQCVLAVTYDVPWRYDSRYFVFDCISSEEEIDRFIASCANNATVVEASDEASAVRIQTGGCGILFSKNVCHRVYRNNRGVA